MCVCVHTCGVVCVERVKVGSLETRLLCTSAEDRQGHHCPYTSTSIHLGPGVILDGWPDHGKGWQLEGSPMYTLSGPRSLSGKDPSSDGVQGSRSYM